MGLQVAPFDVGSVALVCFSHARCPTERTSQNPFSDSFLMAFSEVHSKVRFMAIRYGPLCRSTTILTASS